MSSVILGSMRRIYTPTLRLSNDVRFGINMPLGKRNMPAKFDMIAFRMAELRGTKIAPCAPILANDVDCGQTA